MIREAPQQHQQQQHRQTGLIEIQSTVEEEQSLLQSSNCNSMPISSNTIPPPPPLVPQMLASAATSLKNKSSNLTLNQSTNQHLNPRTSANQTTIVQIPKQSSRPRIFLLTRPAKPSLVRIVNPIKQHYEKDLNLLPHHLPQVKNKQEFLKTVKLKTFMAGSNPLKTNLLQVQKKDLIQVPQATHSQYAKITAQSSSPIQLKRKLQDSLIIHQEIIKSPQQQQQQSLTPPSPSQVTLIPSKRIISVKKQTLPIPINNTVQANQYNLVKSPISKKGPAQMPLTLSSMAGIELTGADMSHTAADMSGAMPPTATVEEINVPVFLDEYLQQAAAISTSAASATASVTTTTNNNHIIFNNNSSSNNNNNHISNYPESGEEGSEAKATTTSVVGVQNGNDDSQHCLETFDNFEFDIDLLTENRNSDIDIDIDIDNDEEDDDDKQDKALELQQLLQGQQQIPQQELFVQTQQQFLHVNSDQENVKEEKQKQQLQLMIDDILFNNNNNNNNNNNSSCSNNNNNSYNTNNILNNNNNININNNNNHINNNNNGTTFKMINDPSDIYCGEIEDLFNVAPNSQVLEEILSPPSLEMDLSNFSPTMENAVDFNQNDNECLSLLGLDVMDNSTNTSYFINSQPTNDGIMFSAHPASSAFSQNLNSSVAALSQEILGAEPHIPPDMIHYTYTAEPSCSSGYVVVDESAATQFIDEDAMDYSEMKLVGGGMSPNPLKRVHSSSHAATTQKHLQEKRMKLRLDIKTSKDNDTQSQELNTPAIINSILQNDEFNTCVMSPAENSTDIYNHLISSPHESIVKSELDTGDYTNDITPPYTPYSLNSTSQQTNFTGFINSSPSSPASSIATTNATSSTATTARRGRGRPAKVHSDKPDLTQIASEAERKKALERYKNNEASRKSRLKNKERDMALEQEEKEQSVRAEKLDVEFQMVKRIERKLRLALKRRHFRGFAQ